MQLVHSALRTQGVNIATTARRQGYLAACYKHRDTIAAIQRYLPGWLPYMEPDDRQLAIVSRQLAVNHSR